MSDGNKGSVYDISKLGEINVIKDRKLTTYQFESFFPSLDKNYPFETTKLLLPPQQYVEYIEKWMDSKRPIRFIFKGKTFDINIPASIENFDWREVAGGMGDIEYSLTLKKYVFYAAKKVKIQPQKQLLSISLEKDSPQRENDRIPPNTYRLVAGDTLWKVAQSQLSDGSRWKEIQTLNNIPDAELKKLPIGLELKLPDA